MVTYEPAILNHTIKFLAKDCVYLIFNTQETSARVKKIIEQEQLYASYYNTNGVGNFSPLAMIRSVIKYLRYSIFFSENIITSDIAHQSLLENHTTDNSDGFQHISPVEVYRFRGAPLDGPFQKINHAIQNLGASSSFALAADFQNSTKNFYFQTRFQLNSYIDFVVSNIKNIIENKNHRHQTYYMIGHNEYSGEVILTDEQFYLLYDYKFLDFHQSKTKIKVMTLDVAVINALVKLIETAYYYKPVNLDIANGGLNSEQYKRALERFQILLEVECTEDKTVILKKLYDYMIYMGVPEIYVLRVNRGLNSIYLKHGCVAMNRTELACVPLKYLKLLERLCGSKITNNNVRRNSTP